MVRAAAEADAARNKKVKPQHSGPSTDLWLEQGGEEVGEARDKPEKVDDARPHEHALQEGLLTRAERAARNPRHALLRAAGVVKPVKPLLADGELTAYLRLEFLFQPRTPDMLPRMANKGRQYLRRYDLSNLTLQRQCDMLTTSIAASLDVSPAEVEARKHLTDPAQAEERHKQAALLTTGVAEAANWLTGGPTYKLPCSKF
jgi:hypothetical protein